MSSPTESLVDGQDLTMPVLKDGHVCLILLNKENSSFYLDIPLEIIQSLCLKPLKYLLFLGWCILVTEGVLAHKHEGDEISTDGNLNEHEIYCYINLRMQVHSFCQCHYCYAHSQITYNMQSANKDLTHTIDLEVIRERTHAALKTMRT